MSSLADALVSKVLGHTAAERAFRPWWDNLEDYLVYALVMLGKFCNDKNLNYLRSFYVFEKVYQFLNVFGFKLTILTLF